MYIDVSSVKELKETIKRLVDAGRNGICYRPIGRWEKNEPGYRIFV